MRGLTLRVTNVSSSVQAIPDLPEEPVIAPKETRELLYTDDVQTSLEYGSLNALRISNLVTFEFVSGTDLSQSPIGRMFTGATPTKVGVRGLVPTTKTTERTYYLRGDGTWSPVTPLSIGAVPEDKYVQQGDMLVRGVTTTERLPLGPIGTTLRASVAMPEWQDLSLAGTLANRPAPAAYYKNVLYWTTDTNVLYLCHYTGSGYVWAIVGSGSGTGGGWDTFPTGGVPTFFNDITHPGRAAVGVPASSAIDTGIQFQVEGSAKVTQAFITETPVEPDQPGSTQLRADSTDHGLYVKPDGYSERRADLPGLTRKEIPNPENIIIPNGSQYMSYESFTLDGSATINLQGDADLVVLGNAAVTQGLTRKFIPAPETVTVPNGSQYICYESLTIALGASLVLVGDADLVVLFDEDVPGLTRKFIPAPEVVTVPNGSQYICYESLTIDLGAALVLLGDADLVVLFDEDVPGLTRKYIPGPETVTVPNGSQYICYESFTLGLGASLVLLGDADLVVLQETPVPWTGVTPIGTIQTTNATPATILTLGTVANKGHALDLLVSATKTDRSDQVVWKVLGAVTRDGGGVVTVRSFLATPSGPTTWAVTVTSAGTNILVNVTGALATNIDWIASGSLLV